ncbi:MAG: 3'-5' exonuclease, partial [Bacteroidota bacterium]|nr:3'-5' exonuclease [Bacteroidota bacterium]
INHNDEEAIRRVINYPARGIGKTTLEKLNDFASKSNKNLWDVLLLVANTDIGLNKGTVAKIGSFTQFILKISEGIENRDAYESAMSITGESGIFKQLRQDNSPEAISRSENVNELLNGIKEFIDTEAEDRTIPLSEFLENVALLTDQDSDKEEDFDKVTLMTIHSAKGLEFKHVFVVGIEEGLFPSQLSAGSLQELEEERRLFYVAITRAEDSLCLSFAKSRYKWGNIENSRPSRFLKEIDPVFIEEKVEDSFVTGGDSNFGVSQKNKFKHRGNMYGNQNQRPYSLGHGQHQYKENSNEPLSEKIKKKPTMKKASQISKDKLSSLSEYKQLDKLGNPQPISNDNTGTTPVFKPGQIVKHGKFGRGKVVEIEGELPNTKVIVQFEGVAGRKKLLTKFAKLEVLR